jgi:hypothetical protein
MQGVGLMGMFDYVTCPPELLPDGFVPDGYPFGETSFQTKDFDSTMASYRITPEGRLEIHLYDMQPTGKWYYHDFNKNGEKVYCEKDEMHGGSDPTLPYAEFERVGERWAEVHSVDGQKYTGEFSFYASERTPQSSLLGGGDKWHEYIAKFVDGQLVEIRDDSDRMERAMEKLKKEKGV